MIIEEIKNCARCGKNHNNVEMIKLFGFNPHYTHFAFCPINNQPILIKQSENGQNVMIISHEEP